MKRLPPSRIHNSLISYWPDIVALMNEINRGGKTFYSLSIDKIHFKEYNVRITEEIPQMIFNNSVTIARFYNERYKLVMRFGDGTTPLTGDLYVLFRNESSSDKKVGYIKCNRGILTIRYMEPVDSSGEILFKSLHMALPGPLSYFIQKMSENEIDIIRLKHRS